MTNDPDESTPAHGCPGTAYERGQRIAIGGWRGPGWRMFDACPADGSLVRDWITPVVSRHGCLADPADAALVVSELFANALMHGPAGGRVLVGYCLWPGGVRIVVCDGGGATVPRLGDPGELEESGRGLQVVDAVAAAWGSFRVGRAQAVWCDLGKPLDTAVSGKAWAWLHPLIATVGLAATRAQAGPPGFSPARASSGRHAIFALA